MRFVGIDVHRDFAQVAELTDVTSEVVHYRVELDAAGLAELKGRLGPDTRVVMEASTGTFRLCDELAGVGAEVVVANPYHVKGAGAHHVKTDRRDSEILARLLHSGFINPVWVPTRQTRALRGLVEHRMEIGRRRAAVKNFIRALLRDEGIEPPVQSTLFDARGLKFLANLRLGVDEAAAHIDSLVRVYHSVNDELVRVDEVLTSWSRKPPEAHTLITIPGMGWVLAAVILAQVGDVKRFSSAKKLCAYAGLVPRVHQSGKTRRTGAVSLSGRKILRHALHNVTLHAKRREGVVKQFHDRLAASRPKALARVAAMRKLLTVIWHMLTRAERIARTRRATHRPQTQTAAAKRPGEFEDFLTSHERRVRSPLPRDHRYRFPLTPWNQGRGSRTRKPAPSPSFWNFRRRGLEAAGPLPEQTTADDRTALRSMTGPSKKEKEPTAIRSKA